jgi:hypothetical protein
MSRPLAPRGGNDRVIENWKPIPGYAGYEASDQGRIRSWRPRLYHPPLEEPRLIQGSLDKDGYRRVILCMGGGKQVYRNVRQLIAETWIGPRPEGLVICHENGIKTDDRASNLAYKTQRDNILDKHRHGTMLIGEKNNRAKLKECEVIEIFTSKDSVQALAAKYGVTDSPIYSIRKRQTWKHVTKDL